MKNKKLLQLASFVLALLVCFGSLPLSFTANAVSAFWESESLSTEPTDTANESSQTPTTYESAAYFTDEKAGGIREVSERREENIKHFAMTNGSYTAVVYAHPVHCKDILE